MAKPKWLFMVYMVAGDSDGLDSIAVQDLQEMENGVRESPDVEVYVQVHRKWPAKPQRYTIANGSGTTLQKKLGLVNMGDEKTLTKFLIQAPEANKYCLVLWGHSYGLGFGREHGNKLMLSELREALAAFEKVKGKRLDLLGANTCTLAYAEAIFELRNSADYMVASEVFVPLAGWPYQEILSQVRDQSPETLGSLIATRYLDFYNTPDRDERVAMTLLQLGTPADKLSKVIEDLATGIRSVIQGEKANKRTSKKIDHAVEKKIERRQRIQDAFLINPAGQIRPVLDLVGLANDLTGACGEIVQSEGGGKDAEGRVSQLKNAAEAVKNVVSTLKLQHMAHPELSDLNGVGIFAPFVIEPRLSRYELEVNGLTEEELKKKSLKDYLQLEVFNLKKEEIKKLTETNGNSTNPAAAGPKLGYSTWPILVFDELRPNRPPEIVNSAGVVRPADRSAVSHMVFAVDAAFNRLSRVLPLAQASLVKALKLKQSEASRLQNISGFGPPHLRLAGDRSMQIDPKKFRRQRQYRPSKEPTEIVRALQSIEVALSRVEQITRRVVTDAQFGIGPAASPGSGSSGFDNIDKSIDPGFVDKTIDPGFVNKTIDPGFVNKTIDPGFAGDNGFVTPNSDADHSGLGSQLAFATADPGLGSLAMIHLFQSIAHSFRQLELAVVGVEDQVATFLEKPEFGAILSRKDYEEAIKDRMKTRFAVLQETSLQALRAVRGVLAHPTFGIGPGPSSIGRGAREALAAQAGLSRQRLLLL